MTDDNGNQPDGLGLALDLGARIKLELGRIGDGLDQANRRLRDLTPVDYRVTGAGNAPASGALVLDLGGPPQGMVWLARRFVVVAPVATAGTAVLYGTADPLNQSPSDAAAVLTVATTAGVPAVDYFSNRQVPVVWPEHAVVTVLSGTSGDLYVAAVQMEAYKLTQLTSQQSIAAATA